MNARLSPDREWTDDGRVLRPDDRALLSVSPRRMPAEAGMPAVTPTDSSSPFAQAAPPQDFLGDAPPPDAPLDSTGQASLDRFAAELSAMIEVAACTADTLNRRMTEASEGENRAAATSAQLQEQLRTGARMLKAFQTQIARVEETLEKQEAYERQVADVQSKIEECFAGIETCVDRTLETVAMRLAELAHTAVERFEEGIAQREVKLAEIDARIAQCAMGLDGVCEMIEQAQGSAAEAVSANERTLDRLSESANAARQLLSQHEQARRSLASDLRALEDGLQTIETRSLAHSQAAAEALQLSVQADATLRDRLVEIERAQGESDRVMESVAALNDLLTRLEPWEKLLLSGTTADGLPEPLAKVAGEVRQQISQDMNWLSLTMKDVAERVSQLAQVPAVSGPARGKSAKPAVRESRQPSPAQPEATDPQPQSDAPPATEPEINVKKPLRLRSFKAGA